jgi:1,4-dihydroxy-2-naphthoate polyprenyltransferase
MIKWISAARLRTLPLALSCIFMGSFLAKSEEKFEFLIFFFATLTTIFLQILSNFANDYGDTQNGADLSGRIGPVRAVQSGEISSKQMMTAIIIMSILSLISGILLLKFSFTSFFTFEFLIFFVLGILCIIAAYTYTAGKNPYGYAGLGDASVFIFFGLVGVLGSTYLFTKSINFYHILPAFCCGLLATGVLNLNNIRDIESDQKAGKITIPVRIGKGKAKIYHYLLITLSIFCTLLFMLLIGKAKLYYILSFPLLILNAFQLYKVDNPDALLKRLAMSTLLFVILFGISII